MRGEPISFWGKLDRDANAGVIAWHPLPDHCADVAACTEVLLAQSIVRDRLAGLGGADDLDPVQCARLCVLAALHDLGKFNLGFQSKAKRNPELRAGHVSEALAFFDSDRPEVSRLAEALDLNTLATWADGDEKLCHYLIASLAHHGRPRPIGGTLSASLWKCSSQLDPFTGIADLVARLRSWFPLAWQTGGESLPSNHRVHHGFGGLVTLADWVGSDTRFFPFSEPHETGLGYIHLARERAQQAVRYIGLSPAGRGSLGAQPINYSRLMPHAPREVQAEILRAPVQRGGSITVLEAQTGDGKTEAALVRFLVLYQAGEVDGIYFALPTRTAATQIHTRVVAAVARAFPEPESRPPVVLAVPGYLRVDDRSGRHLPGFEVLWEDDETGAARSRGWAAERSKRFLCGSVVVGTIDQALLSALAVPHSHMRATSLLRLLLVVDEVHASDTYMGRLLEAVLERQVAAGGHVLLMSATLGAALRDRLLRPGESAVIDPLADARARPFPLIVQRGRGGAVQEWAPHAERRSEVAVHLASCADDPDRVAEKAITAALGGAKVLVIRNTVSDCVATQQAVEAAAARRGRADLLFTCEGAPAPHHSRYSRDDRELLDRGIESVFGKERPDGGRVAVATQTVQQSLDLDADYLMSDICPMDVLLQRIGRLHRHHRPARPTGFERPTALVLVPEERDLTDCILSSGGGRHRARGPHGIGTVYEDLRIIEATWRCLEGRSQIRVPEDCRELVEDSLHPEALRGLEQELGERWVAHGLVMTGASLGDRRMADLNLACWEAAPGSRGCLFPEDLDRRVGTRLGQGDRRVVLPEPAARGPFGQPLQELTLPAHLVPPGTSGDAVPEGVMEAASAISFSFGGAPFIYDRLGLRRCGVPGSPPRTEEESDA